MGGWDKRTATWLFVSFASVYSLTAPGHMWGGDGVTRLQLAWRMVEGFGWTLKPEPEWVPFMVQGTDSRWYSIYGFGQTLAFLPFVLLTKGVMSVWKTGMPADRVGKFLASFLNPLEGALLCVVFFLILARHLRFRPATSVGLPLVLGFASLLWPHTRDNYDHIQAALFLYAALFCTLEYTNRGGMGWLVLAGASAGFAFITRIDSVLFFPALLIALAAPTAWRGWREVLVRCLGVFAGAVPFFIFFGLYNSLRFGSPMETGYGLIFARDPLPEPAFGPGEGLAAFLVSPGRGLLIYSPVVLVFALGIRRLLRNAPVAALSAIAVVGVYVGFFSLFGKAISPFSWGPRQLIPTLPMLLLPAGAFLEAADRRRARRTIVCALAGTSLLVQIPAIGTSYVKPSWEAHLQGASARQATFDWQYFAVWRHYKHFIHAVPATFRGGSFAFLGHGEAPPHVLLQRMITLNILDWWWLYLYWYGMKAVLILPIGLLGLTLLSAWRVRGLLARHGEGTVSEMGIRGTRSG